MSLSATHGAIHGYSSHQNVHKGLVVSTNVRNFNFDLYEREYRGVCRSLGAFVKVNSCERMMHNRKQQNILLRQGFHS